MTNKKSEVRSQKSCKARLANHRRSKVRGLFLAAVLLVACHLSLATAFAGTHVTATYNLGANPIVVATVNGTPEYGLVFVQRNEPVTYNNVGYGKTVLAGYLNASGQLNDGAGNLYLDLAPNTTATPSGSYYVATFNIQGQVHAEIWIVPDQATVDAALIRQTEPSDPQVGPAGPALFYQNVQNSGIPLAQRPVLNFTGTGISCADNAGAGRTDCTITTGSGGGSGSVTSFSSGNLAPLFTASVATATTTPALSFSLSSAAAHTFLGNNTASSAPPAYVQPGFADLSGTATDAQLAGAYSGTGTCASHQWINSLVRNGTPVCAQPAATDILGLAPSATIDTTNAANISSGTLPAAQVPNPTATTLGGIESLATAPHKWINSISTAGAPSATQPDYSDLSGTVPASPNMNVLYAASSCGGQSNCFVVVGDGSTDNSTAFAALASAANAYTQATVNTQKISPLTIYLSTGNYKYASGLSFTQPVTFHCEPGTILNYTGSAHAMDIGPTGLTVSTSQTGDYTIDGCAFTGGASMTEGIYVNQFIVNFRLYRNSFRNFGNSTSTVFAVYLDGNNWDNDIASNRVWNDDATARNFLRVDSQAGVDSQLRFHDNDLANAPTSTGSGCASVSGIGVWVDGYGSHIVHNNFACGWSPAIRVGAHSPSTFIEDNYGETALIASSAPPFIQYGDPSGGYNPGTFIDGLHVTNNRVDMHNASGSSSFFMGPTTGSTGLQNSIFTGNTLTDYVNTREAVQLNNSTGQTGNVVQGLMYAGSALFPATVDTFVHTFGTNVANWNPIGNETFQDSFNRANGAVSFPWTAVTGANLLTIASNLATCPTGFCQNIYEQDLGNNQDVSITLNTLPTGTDQIDAYTRFNTQDTGYLCAYQSGTGIEIGKFVTGTFTLLAGPDTADVPVAGSVLELRSVGGIHTCYLDGKRVLQAVDGSITTGYAGINVQGASGKAGPFVVKGLP